MRCLLLAVGLLHGASAMADRWLEHEAPYVDAIAQCAPHPDVIENDALRTYNWPRGVITFKDDGPGFVFVDGGLSMKFPWDRKVPGRLSIQGRRLDGAAPPLRARIPDGYGDAGFQATGVVFSSPGCWEVTGAVAGHELTFRVYVIKVPGEFVEYEYPD